MSTKAGFNCLLRQIFKDDGDAAKSHLADGRCIYYCDDAISLDHIICEWPDGRRELVKVNAYGHVTIIMELPARIWQAD